MTELKYQERAILASGVAGSLAVLVYVGWSTLPLSLPINRLLHIAFGPLLVCSFMGIQHFLDLQAARRRFIHQVACGMGIVAGVAFTCMTLVQAAMVDMVMLPMQQTADAVEKAQLRQVLIGTNSVQLGLDVAWDVFITTATVLVALSLMSRQRVLAVLGVLIGAATLILNLWTFPLPPAQTGAFDLGPFVGMWFGAICVLMLRAHGRGRGGA